MTKLLFFCVATAWVLQTHITAAHVLTGALIGTVKDAQGGALQWQAFGSYRWSRASGLQPSSTISGGRT